LYDPAMKRTRLAAIAAAAISLVIALAAPAHADVDTDFANELHTYGIYGQRDYNAWLGKIACKRLWSGQDPSAFQSAKFLFDNLPRTSRSEEQTWQFLAAAIGYYCPDQRPVLDNAAAAH
jgi:hypothetical protein